MNPGLTAVSSLDWKLGARMLLKHPALTIIGGLSLAAAIAIGVVGIEVAGELLYKRLPFDEGSRVGTGDPWILVPAGVLLSIVAMGAAFRPARTASRIDPTALLRHQ